MVQLSKYFLSVELSHSKDVGLNILSEQFPLLWEDFPPDFVAKLQGVAYDVGQMRLRSRLIARQSTSSTPKWRLD